MIKVSQYRICALLLAGVFCVFNIGLPVIVATCPMMSDSTMRSSCCYENNATAGLALRSQMNTSCCRTIVAAERNTNEFLQGTNFVADLQFAPPVSEFWCNVESFARESIALYSVSHSPPFLYSQDIPVATSSLLI